MIEIDNSRLEKIATLRHGSHTSFDDGACVMEAVAYVAGETWSPVWTGKVAMAADHALLAPLKRKKPTTYFVNSMGDLFHEDVPDAWINRVFAVMALCPQHTFQVLTKRSARMRDYMNTHGRGHAIGWEICDQQEIARADVVLIADPSHEPYAPSGPRVRLGQWPLPNVWLGVSAERQQEADVRIPDLLATPAAVRFVSAEPLLGAIDLGFVGNAPPKIGYHRFDALTGREIPWEGIIGGVSVWATNKAVPSAKLDWIIVGGESGPSARPMHPDWARSIRDQCAAAGKSREDKLIEAWNADRQRFFEARDALYQFKYPPDPKLLREIADEIDCGNDCAHGYTEWDSNAHVCSRSERKEGCAGEKASCLRQFADAIGIRSAAVDQTGGVTSPDYVMVPKQELGSIIYDIENGFTETAMKQLEKLLSAAPPSPRSEMREALEAARQFIVNGVELGYIHIPKNDPAEHTLGKINAALKES